MEVSVPAIRISQSMLVPEDTNGETDADEQRTPQPRTVVIEEAVEV